MSIETNQIILSSDIVDRLKSINEKPLRYLNNYEFADSSPLPYYSNWNADAVGLFSNGRFSPNQTQRNELFDSITIKQNELVQSNLGNGTPKVYANTPLPNVPVVSFDDLSSFVANAFIPFSDLRYSSFTLLKNVSGMAGIFVRDTVYGNALLTETAITGNIEVLSNVNDNSKNIGSIDSLEKFLQYSKISNDLQTLKNGAVNKEISASLLSLVIEKCLDGINTIRKELSCQFTEIPLTGPGSQTKIIYYRNSNGNGEYEEVSVDIYTRQTINSYIGLFEDNAENEATFRGWSTTPNASSINQAYMPGSIIYVQQNEIKLYPILKNIYTITFHNNKTSVISQRAQSELSGITGVYSVTVNAGGTTEYRVFEDETFRIVRIDNQDSKYNPFNFNPGQSRNPSGYSRTNGGAVNYSFGSSFIVKSDIDLWPVWEPQHIEFPYGIGTHWSVPTRAGTYRADIYPVVADIGKIAKEKTGIDGFELKNYKTIKITFVGWVNEFHHTHPETVYVDIYCGDSNNKILIASDQALYSYSAGNIFSYYTSELAREDGYPGWGSVTKGAYNLPEASKIKGNTLYFYFYTKKGGNSGDGEGEVYIDSLAFDG